jgi:DNA-directed RNA polymerase subunit RPC12/RpoP
MKSKSRNRPVLHPCSSCGREVLRKALHKQLVECGERLVVPEAIKCGYCLIGQNRKPLLKL